MTEQNLPAQDSPLSDSQVSSSSAEIPEAQAAVSNSNGAAAQSNVQWETVTFPGTLPLEEIDGADSPDWPIPKVADFTKREAELLQLIQDLNQCNDALLGRVGELEEALEQSEAALQTEVERAQQNQSMTSAEAQAAIAQQQQQFAQLLSELDIANDAVRRTTIHNETLQAELDNSKQRVAQLERECTLLQQRFSEKGNALQQAEATCRDLRSRLQRQQHYTLQFKAALEKCLDMSAQRSSVAPAADFPAVAEPALRPHPLAMPKAQQIKPWSSQEESAAQPDHSLDTLLRNLKSVGQGPRVPTPSAVPPKAEGATPPPPIPAPDPEAERLLWQDLERVIDAAPKPESPVPQPANSQPEPPPEEAPIFTEPSPWGAPLSSPAAELPTPDPTQVERPVAESPIATQTDPLLASSQPATALSSPGLGGLPPLLQDTASTAPAQASSTSPSPTVYPLRPQKKIKSISAVQLPSFPKPKRSQ